MHSEDTHLTDQELLLAIDGELSPRDTARVDTHLAACWTCRARKQELDSAVAAFVRTHHRSLDPQVPPVAGSRALLKAQLDQLVQSGKPRWFETLSWRIAAVVFASVALAFVASRFWIARQPQPAIAVALPNPSLTPGATVLVSLGDVCRESNTKNKAVPVALQRKVFAEYGIDRAEPRAYEVDYLITPALGGADDIHNLWPQSYADTVWNAQVKDALEDHMRDLVCQGQLDLATAQHEIAVNWIDAYKKYFHTDRPIRPGQ
jgi:hypothetical protein